MVLIGILWIPVIRRRAYDDLQGMQGYLVLPIFTVSFLGVFSKRMNVKGALSALGVWLRLGRPVAVDMLVTLKAAVRERLRHGRPEIVNNIIEQLRRPHLPRLRRRDGRGQRPHGEAGGVLPPPHAPDDDRGDAKSRTSWGRPEVAWSGRGVV